MQKNEEHIRILYGSTLLQRHFSPNPSTTSTLLPYMNLIIASGATVKANLKIKLVTTCLESRGVASN
jgi:hypothetical protein